MRADDFLKVLEFMVTQANHHKLAPVTQQGIQLILDGKDLTLVAVDNGSTTTVKMLPQGVSGGKGEFYIPFDDVETMLPALRHECRGTRDGSARVTVQRSEMPYIAGRTCLHVCISDWSEHYLGNYKEAGLPKRSAVHSQVELTQEHVRLAANQLKVLRGKVNQYGHTSGGNNSYRIDLVAPGCGTKSVSKVIY